MTWTVEFYNDSVEQAILEMPPKIQARMIRLLEMIEKHGVNIEPPHTDSLQEGLFEVRAKASEGIGRALYCYLKGKRVIVLYAFVKKTNKTPKSVIDLARKRKAEIEYECSTAKK